MPRMTFVLLQSLVDWSSLQAMRLLLQQPSPVWRTFHVEEMAVLRELPRRVPRLHATPASSLAGASVAGSVPQQAISSTSLPEVRYTW